MICCGQQCDICCQQISFIISLLHFDYGNNCNVYCCFGLESKQPIDEVKNYGRLGPETVMFNYSGCAGIIIVEADRLGVSNICFS